MTPREMIDTLSAAVAAGQLDPDEDLSIAIDVGEQAILGEIDFLDAANQALVCTCWGTAETVIDFGGGQEEWDE